MSKRKSDYERGVFLEMWIGRVVAWSLWMVMIAITILFVLHLLPASVSFWNAALAVILLGIFAGWSAKCEYKAEAQLKTIWETEMTERMVHGD